MTGTAGFVLGLVPGIVQIIVFLGFIGLVVLTGMFGSKETVEAVAYAGYIGVFLTPVLFTGWIIGSLIRVLLLKKRG